MRVVNADEVQALTSMSRLIECLREAFRQGAHVPRREAFRAQENNSERLFIVMPAFDVEGGGVVKLATFFPDNASRGVPVVQATIVVFSRDGRPEAVLDGTIVTKLRTAAASALASSFLSREDSENLVVFGTGALAPYMAMAHCAARPIRRISICGRQAERVNATVAVVRRLIDRDIEVLGVAPAEEAVRNADIVSCATSSSTPVFAGEWLKPGTFVDLVGSFSPLKREADDEAIRRSRIFVDTLDGALAEAGDLLDPLRRGIIPRNRIEAELRDLVCGRALGRVETAEITLFKSVGTALADLAAAQLIVASLAERENACR